MKNRVYWELGQQLLPDHLFAQEEALLSCFKQFSKNYPLPIYGISDFVLNNELLKKGVLSFKKLKLIFSCRSYMSFPENTVIEPLDLNQLGKESTSIYLHLMNSCCKENGFLGDNENKVNVIFSKKIAVLSEKAALKDSVNFMKIAQFERKEDHWFISNQFIPPLIHIYQNPFMPSYLEELKETLETLIHQKKDQLNRILELHTILTTLILLKAKNLLRYLKNASKNIFSHPVFLYEKLYDLVDVLSLKHEDHCFVYEHEYIQEFHLKALSIIRKNIQTKNHHFDFCSFKQECDYYILENIKNKLSQDEELFLVIENQEEEPILFQDIKLSSSSKAFSIRQFSLPGIPLYKTDFAPQGKNTMHIASFKIGKENEWEQALVDNKLVLFDQNFSKNIKVDIYWKSKKTSKS